MSTLVKGIGVIGNSTTAYVVDMRDEIITNATQFMEAIYRLHQVSHSEKIVALRLSPTQEYCLRLEQQGCTFHRSENRPYMLEEIGQLKQFMGYTLFVNEEIETENEEGEEVVYISKQEIIQAIGDPDAQFFYL